MLFMAISVWLGFFRTGQQLQDIAAVTSVMEGASNSLGVRDASRYAISADRNVWGMGDRFRIYLPSMEKYQVCIAEIDSLSGEKELSYAAYGIDSGEHIIRIQGPSTSSPQVHIAVDGQPIPSYVLDSRDLVKNKTWYSVQKMEYRRDNYIKPKSHFSGQFPTDRPLVLLEEFCVDGMPSAAGSRELQQSRVIRYVWVWIERQGQDFQRELKQGMSFQ
ncbi:hypothetical protein [Blastopirellula marina]|uniref:hypothetical protein n=1 Tax=Blastopirellula marina TaxID=124 RepID=UPI0011B05F92|nr:hypothetical protein [Blastopirellula marina]